MSYWRRALAIAGLLVIAAALFTLREPVADALLALGAEVRELGVWGPVVFTAALAAGVPLCLPATPFLLAAGLLFGPAAGPLYAAAGVVLGGALCFLLARKLLRSVLERRLAARTGFEVMNRALEREGARAVALVRLSPALPAWLINYGLGVSRVSWRDYWLSSLSVLPSVALYALAGAGLGDLAALERGAGPERGALYYSLLGAGIAATLAASVLLGRRARQILRELEESDA